MPSFDSPLSSFPFERSIVSDDRFRQCLKLPFWRDVWEAAAASVGSKSNRASAPDDTESASLASEPVRFQPSPLALHAAQLENKCWRHALYLHVAVSATAISHDMRDVALALLVQCPDGEAHEARRLLDLSPISSEGSETEENGSTHSGRARFSLRALLTEGPLAPGKVERDRKARSAETASKRFSCFLPMSDGERQDSLPLSPMCMYAPLQTLYKVTEVSKVRAGPWRRGSWLGHAFGILLPRAGRTTLHCS